MRIAEESSWEQEHCDALVTGESIGQVASQTIQGLNLYKCFGKYACISDHLIAMDKTEIIEVAQNNRNIWNIYITRRRLLYSILLLKRPVTKPKLDRIEKSDEITLDVEKLIQDAIDNIEVEDIEF